MPRERGGVDQRRRSEEWRTPTINNSSEKRSLRETISEGVPDCLGPGFDSNSGRWFQHEGEFLVAPEQLLETANRLETISQVSFTLPSVVTAEIPRWDTAEFIGTVEEHWQDTTSNHSFLVPVPTPDIEQQEDHQTARITVDYTGNRSENTTEMEWKRNQIVAELRDFDYWVYHTNVIRPSVEHVSGKFI